MTPSIKDPVGLDRSLSVGAAARNRICNRIIAAHRAAADGKKKGRRCSLMRTEAPEESLFWCR